MDSQLLYKVAVGVASDVTVPFADFFRNLLINQYVTFLVTDYYKSGQYPRTVICNLAA